MATEREILEQIEREGLTFAPLTFQPIKLKAPIVDAAYNISWKGKQGYRFVADVKARATSQVLAAAAERAKSVAYDFPGSQPLVIVPYLSASSIAEVERLGISAIDLCGNGIIQVPQQWLVVRSGNRNRFRTADPLRNAYRGVASLVARAFAVNSSFKRVSDIQEFIVSSGGAISLATVSKSLRQLEEDLVIVRETVGIRLLQPEKLFSKLRNGYKPPKIRSNLRVKAKILEPQIHQKMVTAAEEASAELCLTGISSARYQTVFAAEPISSFYCSCNPEDLLAHTDIEFSSDPHFPNLELLQTNDPRVYFNRRRQNNRVLASPIQTWLELELGDKRSREVASTLKYRLLQEVAQ